MKLVHKIIIAASFTSALGTGVYEVRQNIIFDQRVKSAKVNESNLVAELSRLKREKNEAVEQLARMTGPDAKARQEAKDVYRLRGQVTALRRRTSDAPGAGTEPRLKALAARISALKGLARRFPSIAIPEIENLNEDTWMDLAKTYLSERIDEDDAAARRVFMHVRRYAKLRFGMRLHRALMNYLKSSHGALPSNIMELKRGFEEPVEDALLQRYEMLQTGSVENVAKYPAAFLVGERAPVDPDYDSRLVLIGTNKVGTVDVYQREFRWDPPKGQFATPNPPRNNR